MNDACPICGVVGCTRSYPLMLARWAAGRDREHWRRIHDEIDAPPGDRPSVSESLSLIRRMEACPDREKRTDCGCAGLATCHRGKGDARGLVSPQQCFQCLREGD